VNRQLSSATRLAATALLVGIAVVGCARHDAGSGPTAPVAQPSQAAAAPTLAPNPTQAAISTGTPAATDTATTTPDPLDSQLTNLQNLLNGIDSSLSGSDAGPSAGE
jgi:hypothetical protein